MNLVPGIVVHVQAVDTRPLSLLPCCLGMRLVRFENPAGHVVKNAAGHAFEIPADHVFKNPAVHVFKVTGYSCARRPKYIGKCILKLANQKSRVRRA